MAGVYLPLEFPLMEMNSERISTKGIFLISLNHDIFTKLGRSNKEEIHMLNLPNETALL